MIKRILRFTIITVCFAMLVLVTGISSAYGGESREWRIDDDKFAEITGKTTTEIDGLTMYPGIRRYSSLKLFKGTKYYNYLYMDISTSNNYNAISFHLNGPSDIYIVGKSDNEAVYRRLEFYFPVTKSYQYLSLGPANGYKLEYRGEATNVYISAIDEDVRIYDIGVEDYIESEHTELDEGESYSWDFSGVPGGTTYTSNTDFNGLVANASEDKPVISYSGESTDSGYRFYHGIDLEGTGSRYYRSLAFDAAKNSDIYITARSSNYGTNAVVRNLYVTNKYECDIEDLDGVLTDSKFSVSGVTATYRIRYRGNGEKIYIKSEDGGIRIDKIDVVANSDKTIDDHKWIFSNYSELTAGSYLYNKTINGLTITSTSNRPAIAAATTEEGYTKAIRMSSSHFGNGSTISFDISDSSGSSSAVSINSGRTIRVVAKGSDKFTRLILGNKYGYVIGSYNMTADVKEYVFNYNGGYDKLYLFTYAGDGYNISSEIYSISTSDLSSEEPKIIESYFSRGVKYKYNFTVENISNPKDYYYTIKYDSSKLALMNIGKDYNNSNVITDNDIQVISNTSGKIEFRILNLDESDWSGIITSAVFNCIAAGKGSIEFSVVRG
ncbi:MAG: hypothetical protein Q4D26_09830 [Clostridia bacterium]|nr:hypothetical protein [Clostridia bacterium]